MPFCPNCGKEVSEDITFCPGCGQRLQIEGTPENTSGQGELATVPEEVKGWSWGAFVLTWIWGIFNSVWISLLCLIPLLTLIPYALLYGIIKTVTLSYIHLRYIFRRGIKVTFGPRTIFAR